MSEIATDNNIVEPNERTPPTQVISSIPSVVNGKIADTIGTGENAKNSIVYLTIKWAFIAATIISALCIINAWLFRENEKVPDFTAEVETVWKIVIPIITLALGYQFGKHENKEK